MRSIALVTVISHAICAYGQVKPADVAVPAPIVSEVKKPDEKPAKDFQVEAGIPIRLFAGDDTKSYRWILADTANAILIEDSSSREATFSSAVAGKYTVYAYTADKDKPSLAAKIVITVGKPIPPMPPTPPVPPVPIDPFSQSIADAFAKDGKDAAGLAAMATLAELYLQSQDIATDATLKTLDDVLEHIRAIREKLKLTGLTTVRIVINAELKRLFPVVDGELADTDRKALSVAFSRVRAAVLWAKAN